MYKWNGMGLSNAAKDGVSCKKSYPADTFCCVHKSLYVTPARDAKLADCKGNLRIAEPESAVNLWANGKWQQKIDEPTNRVL
jgi:hypothetical protein